MRRSRVWIAGILLAAAAVTASHTAAQEPAAKVDFARDVQPIFRQSCYGCHGPSQRMGGLRLDRRGDAMRGGTIAVIGPGNSAGSRLYLKLIGTQFGAQMPLTGPLKPEQVAIIKSWIDQGADWPDAVSGETPLPPIDPLVQRMMAAALFGDVKTLTSFLDRGVNPNARNHAGATALMWASEDLEKTKLLLDRGADPNAASDEGRTPLMMAAGRVGGSAVVKLLLDRGAKVDAKAPSFLGETNALAEAAYAGDAESMRLLIDRGADPKSAVAALPIAVAAQCPQCAEMLLKAADKEALNFAALLSSPPFFDTTWVTRFVEQGADVDARDAEGRTLLMLAASTDSQRVDTINGLIARGATVNATSKNGQNALPLARMRGRTPVVDLLLKSGVSDSPAPAAKTPVFAPAASNREAVQRALPLLQKNAISFREKSGCVSCHNNAMAAVAVATARVQGLQVNEAQAKTELDKTVAYVAGWRDRVLQGVGIPGDADTISYLLFGLAAQRFPPNDDTDALARYMLRYQAADGRWRIVAHRPPIESSDIEVTALVLRTLQVYAPKADRARYDRAIAKAGAWIATAKPSSLEDHAFQLLGLKWTGSSAVSRAMARLIAQQRDDGGWGQLSTLPSDAYATGQALYALREAGLGANEPQFARGYEFLRKTQAADGSWFVATRALALQPFFESGFPYGRDQFISAAATGWATTALASAVK